MAVQLTTNVSRTDSAPPQQSVPASSPARNVTPAAIGTVGQAGAPTEGAPSLEKRVTSGEKFIETLIELGKFLACLIFGPLAIPVLIIGCMCGCLDPTPNLA